MDACPEAYRYRVTVRNEHACENRTALDSDSVDAACSVVAQEWTEEVIRNSETIGCSSSRLAAQDVPVLSITLRTLKVQGGGTKGGACAAGIFYVVPGFLFAAWDQEYAVTARADVELRDAGRVLWSGEVYAQERAIRDMYDASTLIYEPGTRRIGTPLRKVLETLRDKVFKQAEAMNERLRATSS